MDTFFISHGSPTLSFDEKLPARQFLKSWEEKGFVHQKPKCILIVSGHWETAEPTIKVVDGAYDTIHRPNIFYDLMCHVCLLILIGGRMKYPAPGAPELAKRVKELLMASGFEHVQEDKTRALDHGAWVPLMLMYPDADIPVCQLSVQTEMDGTHHYNMGRALAPLREEGVLIIGSGSATHNLKELDRNGGPVGPWAEAFDTWLKESLLEGRYEDIKHYEKKAPYAKRTHPRPDHFYPLHLALGAAGENAKAELIHHSWSLGSLSYASYVFKST